MITENKKTKVAVVHNKNHFLHKSSSWCPENPERIDKILSYLVNRTDIFEQDCQLVTEFDEATLDDLRRVHDEDYIKFIETYCKKGGGFLGDSTYFSPTSYEVALLAAGGAIKACQLVLNKEAEYSFALIRPPGHHASEDKFGGYCIFNNAAIAARYLQATGKARKIMIIDWDAHAGNGTMRIFYEDPTVLTVSIHRDPHDFYPHDGFLHQLGRDEGRGYNINIEMPEYSGDEEYIQAFEEVVIPVCYQFAPDFVIGCNGFDGHFSDELSHLQLTSQGYYRFVQLLKKNVGKRLIILMEGGYLQYNGQLTHTILNALLDKTIPYTDQLDTLSSSVTRQKKTSSIFDEKLTELKNLLSFYYSFNVIGGSFGST